MATIPNMAQLNGAASGPPVYTQHNRMMKVATPLDVEFLLAGFSGEENISRLFHFGLDLLVEHVKKGANPVTKKVQIDELLGKSITVELTLADGGKRYFNGICNEIVRGEVGRDFTSYRMEVVPKLWLLTRSHQSRIFQPPESTVPQIIRALLKEREIEVEMQITGEFHPRDYCVQYRETDFDFLSRLMEDEGIFYFFKHEDDKHVMVIANTPKAHPDLPNNRYLTYDAARGGIRKSDRVEQWTTLQSLRSGKYTLWDYCFENPEPHFEASADIQETVQSDEQSHKLMAGGNNEFEIYDFPGEFAKRFDGLDKNGAPSANGVGKIFGENTRTTGIRMQQEAVEGIRIHAAGNCRHLVSGHKFTLTEHDSANGEYVLTGVSHTARENYQTEKASFTYSNEFTCIPIDLPFRPQRVTPKPILAGTQTAVVVGPAGEEIYTDKYGRVKVQFHWDRHGKKDADSSCWIRVATPWAGNNWGMIHIPRIGHEVVIDFLEGDPDQPIIVGSVYNAANTPPYTLPDNKTQSGVKSRSSLGGDDTNFNEIRFEDKKGEEQLYIHAEKNQDGVVENDETLSVGRDRKKTIGRDEQTGINRDQTNSVGRDRQESVGRNELIQIDGDRREGVEGNETITIGKDRSQRIEKNERVSIGGHRREQVERDEEVKITGDRTVAIGKDDGHSVTGGRTVTVKKSDSLNVGKDLAVTVKDEIFIQTGKASITMKSNGDILIKGRNIVLDGSGKVTVKATKDVKIDGQSIGHN